MTTAPGATLARDLEDWYADQPSRPKLKLLGPVSIDAPGPAGSIDDAVSLTVRRRFYAGLLAYLSRRRDGATLEDIVAGLGTTQARARVEIARLRVWLGRNPATGEFYLPQAKDGVYCLSGDLLVDLDLFMRLRARAHATGGSADLAAALDLVGGRPMADVGPSSAGWGWPECKDWIQFTAAAIGDLTHVLVTARIAEGDLDGADPVVATAEGALPGDDVVALCKARIAEARGD